MGKPAASYLRCSDLKQDRSIEGQRVAIGQFAKKHGYMIVREFTDDGISGTTGSRQRREFLKMVKFVERSKGAIETLLVYDISRFSRTRSDEAAYYRYRLRLAGCSVVYVMECLPEGDSADLVRSVLQWHKREQVKQLARDTIRGCVSMAEQGYRVAGQAPFGYRPCYVSRDGTRRTSDSDKTFDRRKDEKTVLVLGPPEEVAVVRLIFHMYVEEGLGYWRIAERLNGEHLPGRKSRYWNKGSVRHILTNPVYAGIACYNRRSMNRLYSIKNRRPEESDGKSRDSSNPRSEWITLEDAHEAIVDRGVFEEAQKVRKLRADKHHPSSNICQTARSDSTPLYLLSGSVFCGHCGSKMLNRKIMHASKNGNSGYGKYVCAGYCARGKSFCLPYSTPSCRLDAFVLTAIKQQIISHNIQVEPVRHERCVEKPFGNQRCENFFLANSKNALPGAEAFASASTRDSLNQFLRTSDDVDYVHRLVRKLLRSLVHRVVLHFKSDGRHLKRVRYDVSDIVLELNYPSDNCAGGNRPVRAKEPAVPAKVIRFDGSDFENAQGASGNTLLLDFLSVCLSFGDSRFHAPCQREIKRGSE